MNSALLRLRTASRALDRDQRFAGAAALALLVTMFLPWYEKNAIDPKGGGFVSDTVSAFGVISFIEAAIFLVSAGVIVLVLARGEGRQFHLPGGDGTVIFGAGLWAALLIFYRVFDRPSVSGNAGTVGIQWGFFVAFVAAGALALAGQRIRAATRPEPPARVPRRREAEAEAEGEAAPRPGDVDSDQAPTSVVTPPDVVTPPEPAEDASDVPDESEAPTQAVSTRRAPPQLKPGEIPPAPDDD